MTTHDARRLRIEANQRLRAKAEAAGEEYADDVPETVEESVERYGPRANQF